MPKQYSVNRLPDLFIDKRCRISPEGYISYRMIICHAIHALHIKRESKETIKIELSNLAENLDKNSIDSRLLFETHILKDDNPDKKLIVIIDKNDGCYPLVLYEHSETPIYRVSAFQDAIEDINSQFESMYDIICNNNFDEELHKMLDDKFVFKSYF